MIDEARKPESWKARKQALELSGFQAFELSSLKNPFKCN